MIAYAISANVWHCGTKNDTSEPRDLLAFYISVGVPCNRGIDYPCAVKEMHVSFWPEGKSSKFAIGRKSSLMPDAYTRYLEEIRNGVGIKEHHENHIGPNYPSIQDYLKQCATCTYQSASKNTLKRHEVKCAAKLPRNNGPTNCDFAGCGKPFATKKKMMEHKRKVHNDVKLECEDCQFTTNRRDTMKRHKITKNHNGRTLVVLS